MQYRGHNIIAKQVSFKLRVTFFFVKIKRVVPKLNSGSLPALVDTLDVKTNVGQQNLSTSFGAVISLPNGI